MLEAVGWGLDIDPLPGKQLHSLHRQGITEPPIQLTSLIQQRPLVTPTQRSAGNPRLKNDSGAPSSLTEQVDLTPANNNHLPGRCHRPSPVRQGRP